MTENSNFIPDIYNWCDRWCERCQYTDRCYSFQLDIEDGIDPLDKDIPDEKTWEHVGKRLAQALEMLRQHAARQGIDLDNLPEVEEVPPGKRLVRLQEQAKSLHEKYVQRTRSFFEENKKYFEDKGHKSIRRVEMGISGEEEILAHWEELKDQSEVIHWYTCFFGVKMHRALNGLDDMHKDHWGSPEQSDANRTARITMVAVERSMAGWQFLLGAFPEKEGEILQLLALLAKFRRLVESVFPRWAEAGPEVVW